jgi:tRNA A-37 threonylcarbamoyl transferase component Bud32
MTPSPESSSISEASESATGPTTETLAQGRYVIVGSLGAGSQAETLEAVDKREGRPVAIKRFTLRGAKSWKDVELAEREASVLASLQHPSLPRYVEHFEENGALYLVMEKVEGESLAARRKRGQSLGPDQVLRFLRDAAECLRYLHGHAPPIVHRDIKPGNVILRPDGSYCLVDFGSVRDRLKPEGGSTVVGTFGFMAPEQFQGRAAPGSDVYAVGATAISLVTGREPEDLPHKGLGIDVEAALRGQVDRRLIAALRSMLEPDPDRRASSVDAALRAAGLADPQETVTASRRPSAASDVQSAHRERHRQRFDEVQEQHRQHRSDREERRARKLEAVIERRARKKAEREARRAERRFMRRHEHGFRSPGRPARADILLGIVILLALRIAGVATFALFGVLLPILFTLLDKPRRRERMREINAAGQRGLAVAREHIRYRFLGGDIPRELEDFLTERGVDTRSTQPGEPGGPRQAQRPAPRQRVAAEVGAEDPERELEREAEAELESLADGSPRRRGR